MTITAGYIFEALLYLGGEAHLIDIEKQVLKIAQPPFPKEPQASIRARLQERCAEAPAYKRRENLYESVHGLSANKGVWRIRAGIENEITSDIVFDGAEAFIDSTEGRSFLRTHLKKERSRKLIRSFKATLKDPRCEACNMSFAEFYGDLGKDYIEAHHRIPVAKLDGSIPTNLSDLAALCANCHRIIHKNGLMPVEVLADHLSKRRR